MFCIAQKATYTWPVVVELPEDGGKFARHTFEAEFRRLSKQEAERLIRSASQGELSDESLIEQIMVGWSAVHDADGEPLPFTPANLRRLVASHIQVPGAIVRAWLDSLGTARQKN